MKRLIALFLMLIMCIGLFTACTSNTPAATPTPAATTPASTPTATPAATPEKTQEQEQPKIVSFTDSVGRTVEVSSQIKRISPSGTLTQMFLLAIAPDLMVTVASEYNDKQKPYIPDYITKLPVVGQFYGTADLNLETIASVNPEIVIDVGEPKKTVVEDMDSITANTAIPAVHITATLRSTPEAFRMLGKLLGREEKGEELAQYCEKILAQTDGIMAKVGDKKVNGLYCLGDTGQNIIAATSFHAEVIDYMMNNLAVVDSPAAKGTGNETDLEQINLWNPDLIIFANGSVYNKVSSDPAWKSVSAVKNNNYVEVPSGLYDWFGNPPSVNRYLSMMWLAKVLYPDYADFDLHAEVKEYYSLFCGYDLTQAKYDELTANAFVK